jgi:hypothetical protein
MKTSPMRRATRGVAVEGRRTIVLPPVRALRESQKGMRKGKFQGEMISVGPRGWK